jgi:hypothetical protein
MRHPGDDFPHLYEHAGLTASRPVRVSVTVAPDFGKAVKLAVSLGFAVKLVVTQPDRALLDEVLDVLDLYLHRSTVCQPVEFFHSLFGALYRGSPTTIWAIQEEDPAEFRYVTDQGEEVISDRLPVPVQREARESFIEDSRTALRAEDGECSDCEFLDVCCGYFKWPSRGYGCDGVKGVLRALKQATEELKQDLAGCRRTESEHK